MSFYMDIRNLTDKVGFIELFPHCQNTIIRSPAMLKTFINLSLLFFSTAESAFKAFYLQNRLSDFDAHIGECSCQIRAFYNLYMQRYYANDIDAKSQCHVVISEIEKLRKTLAVYFKSEHLQYEYLRIKKTVFKNQFRLTDFLADFSINFSFDLHQIYLIHSYLLTRFTYFDSEDRSCIDYEKMCIDAKLSKTTARKIVKKYQIKQSEYSVGFIRFLAAKVKHSDYFLNLVDETIQTDDDGRTVLPTYLVVHVLWQNMLALDLPVILIICQKSGNQFKKYTAIEYRKEKSSYVFSRFVDDEISICSENVMIFYAVADYAFPMGNFKLDIQHYDLRKIFFYNMATHPQYSGKKLSHLKQNPYDSYHSSSDINLISYFSAKFLSDKHFGNLLGYSRDNPSQCFIKHIYSSSDISLYALNSLQDSCIVASIKGDDIVYSA